MNANSSITHDKAELVLQTDIGEVKVSATGQGVEIYLPGCGVKSQENGAPIYLDFWGSAPKLYVWADINEEDYTHGVAFGRALEAHRVSEEE